MTDPTPATDEELFRAFALNGCPTSIEVILERYHPRIRGFIQKRVRDGTHAEDLTSAVIRRILLARNSFDATRCFSSWVHTIAVNLVRNHFRGEKRRRVFTEADFRLREGAGGSLLDAHPGGESPEDVFTTNLLQAQLVVTLGQLPSDYRRIFQLRYIDGYSVAEVATMMGLPAGSVKAKGTRARARVLRLMARYLEE